jgi:hypothetical protein
MGCKAVFGKTATLYGCLILTAVLALSLSGCGANLLKDGKSNVKSVIWEHQDQFVRIESQDRDSILVAANDHPANLSANLIRKTLGSLEVRFEGEENPVPVFSPEELEILGEAVSRGLAQADPHEDITFAIAGTHQGNTSQDISTYRLFVEDDRINLIIGTLHEKYTRNPDQSSHPLTPASRKYTPLDQRQTTASWRIVPKIGMEYKTNGALTSDVVTRYDWLILNPTPATFREAARMWEDSAQFETEQQKMSQKIEQMQQSIEQMKQTSTTGTVPSPSAPVELHKIEQRLEILLRLKNKGLIDDDEFRAKKQEILDSI